MVLWRIHFHRIEIEKRYQQHVETGFLKICTPHFIGRQLLVIPSLQMFVFLLTLVLLFCDSNFIFCAFFPFFLWGWSG